MTPATLLHRPQAEPVILEELLIWGVRWNNVHSRSNLNFSSSSVSCLYTALSQSDLLLLTLQKGRQLSFQVLDCQGPINHIRLNLSAWSHSFLSTVGIMTEEND